jgi:hypothetical protein
MAPFKDAFLKLLDQQIILPDLGSDELPGFCFSDRETNAIGFAVSFAKHALSSSRMKRILLHYGPTFDKIEARYVGKVKI